MGHFIRHIAGSEPRTHRGGGKAAVRALLKALMVGVQAWRRRGTAGVVDKERGHERHGAPVWGGARASASKKRSAGLGMAAQGAVDGCAGNSGAHRCGIVLWRRRGRGWHGVEMNLENFNPRLAIYQCRFITTGSNHKPTVMRIHHCWAIPKTSSDGGVAVRG